MRAKSVRRMYLAILGTTVLAVLSAAVAERVFLNEVNVLYDRAYQLCEKLVTTSQSSIDTASSRARNDVAWITLLATVNAGTTIGLGIALLGASAMGLRTEQARGKYFAHLEAARKIQEHFLPDEAPELPGFDIHACCHPAEFAAGDYFDYLPFADGSLGIVVGDVAGHGVGPALLMASTRAYLRSLAEKLYEAVRAYASPGDLVDDVTVAVIKVE